MPSAAPRHVAVGEFDGVHLGHREVIRGADTVLTFEPHPRQVVAPDAAPKLLTSLDIKIDLIAGLGVRELVVIPFDRSFAAQGPQEFIDDVLVGQLGATQVSVGENFRFGHKAKGDADLLRGADRVRAAGRPARRGRRRDRLLDPHPRARGGRRPRAGQPLPRLAVPAPRPGPARRRARARRSASRPPTSYRTTRSSTRATASTPAAPRSRRTASGAGGRPPRTSACARPSSPAAACSSRPTCSTYDGDLYDRELRLAFLARLRGERRFDTVEALVEQMHRDVQEARAIAGLRRVSLSRTSVCMAVGCCRSGQGHESERRRRAHRPLRADVICRRRCGRAATTWRRPRTMRRRCRLPAARARRRAGRASASSRRAAACCSTSSRRDPEVFSTAVVLVAPKEMLVRAGAGAARARRRRPADRAGHARGAARARALGRPHQDAAGGARRPEPPARDAAARGPADRPVQPPLRAHPARGADQRRPPPRPAAVGRDDRHRPLQGSTTSTATTPATAALVEITSALRDRLRAEDELGRLGGEEFLALLPDTGGDAAAGVAEDLRASVRRSRRTAAGTCSARHGQHRLGDVGRRGGRRRAGQTGRRRALRSQGGRAQRRAGSRESLC